MAPANTGGRGTPATEVGAPRRRAGRVQRGRAGRGESAAAPDAHRRGDADPDAAPARQGAVGHARRIGRRRERRLPRHRRHAGGRRRRSRGRPRRAHQRPRHARRRSAGGALAPERSQLPGPEPREARRRRRRRRREGRPRRSLRQRREHVPPVRAPLDRIGVRVRGSVVERRSHVEPRARHRRRALLRGRARLAPRRVPGRRCPHARALVRAERRRLPHADDRVRLGHGSDRPREDAPRGRTLHARDRRRPARRADAGEDARQARALRSRRGRAHTQRPLRERRRLRRVTRRDRGRRSRRERPAGRRRALPRGRRIGARRRLRGGRVLPPRDAARRRAHAVAARAPALGSVRAQLLTSTGSGFTLAASTDEGLLCPTWPLSGMPLGFGDATKRPLYVKTDNNPSARPHYGISKADMVFELLVEGLTTRLAAVYQSQQPDVIGSVRSVRMTDRHVLPSLDAALVYSGGGPEELMAINYDASVGRRYVDLSPNYGWGYRVGFRVGPYNFFTTYAAVQQALAAAPDGDQPAIVAPWRFLPTATGDAMSGGFGASVPASTITIPYRALFGVRYDYDPATRTYARYQDGVRERDAANGQVIAARNIVVIQTEVHFTTA